MYVRNEIRKSSLGDAPGGGEEWNSGKKERGNENGKWEMGKMMETSTLK